MHRRKAIRDAVVAGLSSSPAIAALSPAPSVESSRVVPLDPAALPRLLVYLRGERVEGRITESPREYRVLSDLVIEYVTRLRPNGGPSEDELDAAAEAIETALAVLETNDLGGLVREFDYQGTDVAVELRGELTTCSLVLRYQLELGVVVAPVIVDDFETNVIEQLVGDAAADNVTDTVTLPIS